MATKRITLNELRILVKQIIKEESDNKQTVVGQKILGKRINYLSNNEASSAYEKEVGFILDGDIFLGLKDLEYNEDKGVYVVDNNTKIVYYNDDEDLWLYNNLKPYKFDDESIAEAIFPNKKELDRFYKLLKNNGVYDLQFKTNFNNVITKDSKINKPSINIDKYKDFTFNYGMNDFYFADGEVDLDDDRGFIKISFENKTESLYNKESISLYIHYTLSPLGKLSEKPSVDIYYYSSFMSKGSKVKIDKLNPVIKDILKNLK
jgi:hypothetical protein